MRLFTSKDLTKSTERKIRAMLEAEGLKIKRSYSWSGIYFCTLTIVEGLGASKRHPLTFMSNFDGMICFPSDPSCHQSHRGGLHASCFPTPTGLMNSSEAETLLRLATEKLDVLKASRSI